MIVDALSPLYDPRVRQKILAAKSSFEQVRDETTPDELLAAGYEEDAERKARATSLRIERHDFDPPPFSQFGGIYGAFGDDLPASSTS